MNAFMILKAGHALFGLAAFTGYVLAMAWALKHLGAHDLRKWGLGLLAAGVAGCLILAGIANDGPYAKSGRNPLGKGKPPLMMQN